MAFLLSFIPLSHTLVTHCFRKEREVTYDLFDVKPTMLDEKPALTSAADWLPSEENEREASLFEKMNEGVEACCNSFEKDSDLFTTAETEAEAMKKDSSLKNGANVNAATIEDFEILKLLGKGAYGKVYQVRKVHGAGSGKIFAMKAINKTSIISSQTDLRHTKSERDVLVTVNHPFIVHLHFAFETKRRLYLVQVTTSEIY